MENSTCKTPWQDHMGEVPMHLDYFQGTLFETVERAARKFPNAIAFDFMGKSTSYAHFVKQVHSCANALYSIGIRENDKITIAMPNCPQSLIVFYAANLIGAISSMIHPLSAEKEITFYVNDSQSVAVVTLDRFYDKVIKAGQGTAAKYLIVASIQDELPLLAKIGYALTDGRKYPKPPKDSPVIRWKQLMSMGVLAEAHRASRGAQDEAVLLYSGGTTGTTKGIVLTNLNFNALAQQIIAANPMFRPGDKMLAAMPIFHGFGLGVSIHSMLCHGGRCILIPQFTPKSYANDLIRHRVNFVVGVPTLYEALLRLDSMEGADLSSLKGVFSGGDNLSVELKKKVDQFLRDHNAKVQVREGYGATECVAACCLTPPHKHKEGSIGLPFPDNYVKIVEPGTDREVPYGTEGEILLSGVTVMKAYLHNPDETAQALQTHADGRTWLYTGDLGLMDEEGFVYFKGRAKRMIVSSGYNIYPAQLENVLDAHEWVQMSCVIGVPDSYKMQKVKAFVKLVPEAQPTEETKRILLDYCRMHIAKYAMPYDISFREEMPKTRVGKVAYRVLEEEELSAMQKDKENGSNERN